MKVLIKVAIFLIVIMMGVRACTALPSEPVAYDIVFAYSEVGTADRSFSLNQLAVYSATTSETTPFYVDEDTSGVQPLAWSPSGQYLAILKSYWPDNLDMPFEVEICLLNRDGEQVTCFEEKPPPSYSSTSFQENYDVTWSDDEEMVYFIAERDGMRRLVEIEVASGDTKRVLFETEAMRPNDIDGVWPVTFAWSSNLEYVINGVLERQPVTELVNLETGETTNLSIIIQPLGDNARDTVPNTGFVCDSFSPIHNYMTAIEYSDGQTSERIIVFSPELEAILEIDDYPQDIRGHISACPIWSSDESLLYIYVHDFETSDRYFTFYSVQDRNFSRFQLISSNIYPSSIRLSPNKNHIVFMFNAAYGVWVMTMPIDGDEMTRLAPQWEYATFPLWIP